MKAGSKRILIVKPSSLGDILHAFPAVHALLESEAELKIDWVVHPAFADLLDYMPGVENKILFRRSEMGKFFHFFPAFLDLWKSIRHEKYDCVIDMQGLIRSAAISRLARSGIVYGWKSPKEKQAGFFYTRQLDIDPAIKHAVEKNCAMIRSILNGKEFSPEYILPVLARYKTAADTLLQERGIQPGEHFIAVIPGARWVTKQWPPEFFAGAVQKLAEKMPDISFVLLGSPKEKELCRQVQEHLPEGIKTIDLCGQTTLGMLVETIRAAQVVICNDSGPMHIAAAVQTPVAAMFGPTDPALTGPYSKNSRVLLPEIDCIRCFHKHCDDAKCHTAIPVERLVRAVMELSISGKEKS